MTNGTRGQLEAVDPARMEVRTAERERWSRAVWSVEEYRDRYGVDDTERALGRRPAAGLQSADYDVTANVVEKAIGRDLALERGVELRQEAGTRTQC